MKRLLFGVSAVPYLISFLAVTALAYMIGKIPTRRDKTFLLPWLDFLCNVLTLLTSVAILHLLGLRGYIGLIIACAAWLVFHWRRSGGLDLVRALGTLLAGLGIYRLC
jgi:hypothetical protein